MAFGAKSKAFGILFILFLVCIPFYTNYYFSKSKDNALFQGVEQRKAQAGITNTAADPKSAVVKDTVLLLRDDSVTINDCKLVFKGMQDKMVHLDLYLLELDPQYAYHHSISKDDAMDGIRLGDSEYQLLAVNNKRLKLRINSLFKAQ